jgi:hypothetical protein
MSLDPNTSEPEIFENKTNFFAWIGMVVGVAFLTHFTMSGALPGLVLATLWIFALVGAVAVYRMPLILVEVSASGVSVRERTPFWRREREFAAKDVRVSDIEKVHGGEGGIFYSFSLLLPDRTTVVAAVGNTYEQAEQERLRLLRALNAAKHQG